MSHLYEYDPDRGVLVPRRWYRTRPGLIWPWLVLGSLVFNAGMMLLQRIW